MQYPSGTRVLVWRLDEEMPQLLALCREAEIPVDDLTCLPLKRQREKAAELLLLHRAFGRPVSLLHDKQGAPEVEGTDVNISISHTPQLVVLACNKNQVVGIDAEQCDRQQVLRVRDKFLNANEKQFICPDDLPSHVLAWTAKEAIIKAERNSALDWTNGICLEPFGIRDDETLVTARCAGRRYSLVSRILEDHRVTVATLAVV